MQDMESNRDWTKKLEAKPKYVVSTTRRDFPWSNTHHVDGDLTRAVKALKKATPRGLLVGSPKLSAALQRLDLVDEYRFVVHPVVAGHGPFLFSGLPSVCRSGDRVNPLGEHRLQGSRKLNPSFAATPNSSRLGSPALYRDVVYGLPGTYAMSALAFAESIISTT
jgi:hypothetical protein